MASLACDVGLGSDRMRLPDAGAETRGFAQRFLYANAAGTLVHDPTVRATAGSEAPGWRTAALGDERTRIVWDRFDGEAVERPASRADRVVSVLVEAPDRNAAWMQANRIDADALFGIEQAPPTTYAPRHPIWPIGEPIA